jgi:putative membrane protein
MVTTLLSDADAAAVEAAVARVESRSAAEVVVAVVPRSHDYWQGRVLLAVAWGLAAGLAFLLLEPWQEPALSLPIQVAAGALAFVIAGLRPVLRLLVPRRLAEQAVQARAFQLFAERGLHGTRARTAVLVFVSELEHRVVLLGDQSIDQALGQVGWQRYVEQLVSRIRAGQARQGLVELLEQLEPQLAFIAPRSEGDVNELPDAPVRL